MNDSKKFSFEFFPPKTDVGREKLKTVRKELNQLGPEFFSVTYGAGGSTRGNTKDTVMAMKAEGIETAPHLSIGSDSEEAILQLLSEYKNAGINRIVALRGDVPSGMRAQKFVYAKELVKLIRKETGDHFELTVAAYPETHPDASSYNTDIDFLKQKMDAGANNAITQYFYNADAYFYFLDHCQRAGIDKPIVPGIMPITNFHNLARFSKNCGADIPRWLIKKMESYGDDTDSIKAFGIEVVTRLCENLLAGGAPGLHFYSMNQVEPNKTIWNNLGLSNC